MQRLPKLVKPNSRSSSRTGSSRSSQSMIRNMGPRGPHGCVPAVAAIKEDCQTSTFPHSPPGYNLTVHKTPESCTPTSISTFNSNPNNPPKLHRGQLQPQQSP
ncbi:unnamed protein product [Pleuronectes platessa]|uniref:Uncharacterized protein n=1 Tax=Pleuronectes platessa TaxID=8262 RepID=A0A9N7VS11_PLEPL|nr:unnamed protein product [Pleuronectes platessa]